MGYNKPNPLKMMESALKMYKAEKKGGMHRMESPMYAKEASRELKDMPIVDIERGDAKGDYSTNPDKNPMAGKSSMKDKMDNFGKGNKKPATEKTYGSPAKAAKPDYIDIDKDGNTTESMKDAAKAKGSPAKASNSKTHQHNSMSGQARHDHMKKEHSDSYSRKGPYGEKETKAMQRGAADKNSPVKRQGYNDRLDESLAKDGKESSKKQSMKDRRDESKGMKKSKGKGAYSSDPKMS
tara:strand:- start:4698 stop:5411 length:714 start_codon:yes stop_codon:yes gene_type:complete